MDSLILFRVLPQYISHPIIGRGQDRSTEVTIGSPAALLHPVSIRAYDELQTADDAATDSATNPNKITANSLMEFATRHSAPICLYFSLKTAYTPGVECLAADGARHAPPRHAQGATLRSAKPRWLPFAKWHFIPKSEGLDPHLNTLRFIKINFRLVLGVGRTIEGLGLV